MLPNKRILLQNKAWVFDNLKIDPNYFSDLSKIQKPTFLWIGCADSRVSPAQITDTEIGDIFVHRNLGNLVVANDLNLLSVVQYAIEVLKIQHIIICGHYGCGGVELCLKNISTGAINNWLTHMRDVYMKHKVNIDDSKNLKEKSNKLAEYNILEQVNNLSKTNIIKNSWHKHLHKPIIYGWVYNLDTGYIKELVQIPK